jgi:hypothetical protein
LSFLPQQNQNVTSILLHSQLSTASKSKQNKCVKLFVKKSSGHRFLIDCREVFKKPITKIVVPNQFPCLFVKNLLPWTW